MATITVRALDGNGDPLQGNSQNSFVSDIDAVTQIIATRLKLYQGEFWENLQDGLPLFQSILGSPGSRRNLQTITNLIAARIRSTPFVTDVGNVSASFSGRRLSFRAQVKTQFGTVTITNTPATSALLPS